MVLWNIYIEVTGFSLISSMYSACFFVFCHVYQDTLRGFEQNKKGNNLSFSNYVKLYETIGKVHSSEGQNFVYQWNNESELNRIPLGQKSIDCTSLHCSEVREKHTKCLFFLVTSRFTLKGSNFLSPGRKKEIASRGCWEKEGGRREQVILYIDNIS